MSESRVETILGEAKELERKYEWLGATELYGQALNAVDEKDYFKRGEIQEKIGCSLHRAAFQTESREDFLEKLRHSIIAYDKAQGLYEKLSDEQGGPWILRCKAITKYLSHWIESNPSEKRKLLDECLELEENSQTTFWNLGDKLEYVRTFNEFPLASFHRAGLEWEWQGLKGILEDGVEWGEKAVSSLSELGDPYETGRSHLALGIHLALGGANPRKVVFVEEPEKQEEYRIKIVEHFHKAAEFLEEFGCAYLVGLSHYGLGLYTGTKESIKHYEKALECGEETRDNFLKGIVLHSLAYETWFNAYVSEDPDQRRRLTERVMEFYDRAERHCSIISYLKPLVYPASPPGGYTRYYIDCAEWETDPKKKLEFLDKSLKVGMETLKVAESSEMPVPIHQMLTKLSQALVARASMEPDFDEKKSFLERALKYRERTIEIWEQMYPFEYWVLGLYYSRLGEIKAKLGDIEPDLKCKRKILEEAVLPWEKGLKVSSRYLQLAENIGNLGLFAYHQNYQDSYATLLTHLFELTNEPENLRKAIEALRGAIVSAHKVDMVSRVAESYWKIAKTQDVLKEHLEAAENFQRASESYLKAAEKIHPLRELYQDHATYMEAWSEVEKARHHHAEKRYGEAKENYKKAAELHKSTIRWSHLGLNYLAWARLEEAEDQSRREQTQEARDLFVQAANLFVEAEESIKTKQKTIESGEERRIAEELVKASNIRREYCLGRSALEKARILDRQGDHAASSREYHRAKTMFQKVIDAMEQESERKELRPIVYLCQAWEKTMIAEAMDSPTLYGEAAELFMEAKKHALDQTTSLLAQANSSFCRSLEAGTEFEITRETTSFSEAKRHIEAATSHYLRAGQQTMSEYTRATSRLLDAYMYTYNAQTEVDPSKKAQFYQMAERLLQSSTGAYLKAKHPEKSDELRRILESVKEEREIAVSLSEMLHAPTIVSTTTSFSTPTPTHEQAVGLDRFESADIQANLIARKKEVQVGEDLDLEIELVNAGKAPAQLVKVEEIIPEGFEVSKIPEICRVEDDYINMKGRTLSPLKTVELKLVLKPQNKGTFDLRPKILYLNESGNYKSHHLEPATITVRELGIKGWLRGPNS